MLPAFGAQVTAKREEKGESWKPGGAFGQARVHSPKPLKLETNCRGVHDYQYLLGFGFRFRDPFQVP